MIREGKTTGREHAEFTAKMMLPSSLPPVKTCCLAAQPGAITERTRETKVGFLHLARVVNTLHSLEHREATCQSTFDESRFLVAGRHMPQHETQA